MKEFRWQYFGLLFLVVGIIVYEIYKFFVFRSNLPAQERLEYETFHIELPENLDFCGEKVPLKESDVRERLDRELYINVYWYSSTYLVIKRANRWFPRIEKTLKEQKVPDDFKYLVVAESQLTNSVSPAGATGFWQLLEETAIRYGLVINEEIDERYHLEKSTIAACKYLKEAYKKFGSWTLAAAAYNRGMQGIENAIKEQQVTSYYDLALNPETSRYVFRILAYKEIMTNPKKYRFNLSKNSLYYPEPVRYIEVTKSIPNLALFAKEHGTNLKLLKLHNPWLRSDKLTVKEEQKYVLEIPQYESSEEDEEIL
ncbi:MAG: lytic transglycosylase domain-containing protein [Cytophagales bacterium]|nr:lytic transglycosylase domain-containing protein [Cytophagales bacterium]MDW8383417.1 lytic transglycosylase domain-containing protein [Flammeovirgaceae bacterium]